MRIWLTREVVFHPRGYYRLALSLAKRYPVEVWGRPMPPIHIEGNLQSVIDQKIWHALTEPPPPLPSMKVFTIGKSEPSRRAAYLTIICNPIDLWRLFPKRPLLWDVWEDYEKNFKYEPTYTASQRVVRQLLWKGLSLLRNLPKGYTLAEYAYAGLMPLERSRFLPNAFVKVEDFPPLLPSLAGSYTLYTGNLVESWGLWEAVKAALQSPDRPFIIAGSIKSLSTAKRLREALHTHPQWLWIWGDFVPYPIIQNLQRYAALLYAPYHPLPHLRDKIPGKFYEAMALKVPILYPTGKSVVWDAFWRRYQGADAPELYWSYYEEELLDWVEALLVR